MNERINGISSREKKQFTVGLGVVLNTICKLWLATIDGHYQQKLRLPMWPLRVIYALLEQCRSNLHPSNIAESLSLPWYISSEFVTAVRRPWYTPWYSPGLDTSRKGISRGSWWASKLHRAAALRRNISHLKHTIHGHPPRRLTSSPKFSSFPNMNNPLGLERSPGVIDRHRKGGRGGGGRGAHRYSW